MTKTLKSKKIYFAFIQPTNFSGQAAASKIIIDSLSKKQWDCRIIPLYPLERSIDNLLLRYAKLLLNQFKTFKRLLSLVLNKNPILYLNLGQSKWSFIRNGLWYFPIYYFKKNIKIVISIHGSIFLNWELNKNITKWFLKYLHSGNIITVLGQNQKNKLLEFGINEEKIRIVPNTCDTTIADEDYILKKHDVKENDPINILYLSLLIESKGFPEYLEALQILSTLKLKTTINAVLCGPMSFTSFCTRFTKPKDKAAWINSKIKIINESKNSRVSVNWINGAQGTIKNNLLLNSHIFILPTRFPVEAQPIVLLEALSSGCVIITTGVGEILSTVNSDSARILKEPTPDNIVKEILFLIENSTGRKNMAINGLRLMKNKFSINIYADTWEKIFEEISN